MKHVEALMSGLFETLEKAAEKSWQTSKAEQDDGVPTFASKEERDRFDKRSRAAQTSAAGSAAAIGGAGGGALGANLTHRGYSTGRVGKSAKDLASRLPRGKAMVGGAVLGAGIGPAQGVRRAVKQADK